MLTSLHAALALTPDGEISDAVLLMEDGLILRAGPADEIELPAATRIITFPSATLTPAFLDIHIHGSAGHDVMDTAVVGKSCANGANMMCSFLAQHGVGAFLPTTVTASVDATLRALESIANWIELENDLATAARPVGIHLEGPFISHARRGVHPVAGIQPPGIALFDRFYEAARGHVRLMTLAPEIPGALDLLRHAVARGVRVSLGHSDALSAEARAGIAAGAVTSTHCFNAMRGFDHREPGLLGVVLDDRNLFAEIICDGHHVAPEAIRLYAAAKPADRRILITDAISATGMGDGSFRLGELEVTVAAARATYDGKLAGSVLTLDRGLEHFVASTGLPLHQAAMAASANPAAMLGLPEAGAGLVAGARADINVLGPDGRLLATFLGGQRVQ